VVPDERIAITGDLMLGVSELEKFRKEGEVIRGAPFSFIIVCVVAIGILWGSFHHVYKGKLDDAHEQTDGWRNTAGRWQSDVEFWKDAASRPLPTSTPSSAAPSASSAQTSDHPVELKIPLHSSKLAPQIKAPSQVPASSDPPSPISSTSPTAPQAINAPSCPQGICPTGTTFGNQTVINTPPPSSIEGFEVIPSKPEKDGAGHPITTFKFYVSEPVSDQKFIAVCDRPCSAMAADTLPGRGLFLSGDFLVASGGDPLISAWVINYPIHPQQYQVFTVVSKDTNPVAIARFSFGKFAITPP
jgi:hypothetical protein